MQNQFLALYVHTHLPEKRKVMLTALYIHHDFADRENGNSKGYVSMQNGNEIRIIVYHDHTFYTEISLAMHFISFE